MTDEAFIRAVLDAPGQDTPRLVYADWLDETGAPDRAAYLRAEMEWATLGQTCLRPPEADLRAAAARLDPLWVARVSRPPLGVCCDHLARSAGAAARDADIAAAAGELGVVLPDHLHALLLDYYRLGHLRDGPLALPDAAGPGLVIDGFVCLTDPDLEDGLVSHELVDRTLWLREEAGLNDGFVYLAGTVYDSVFLADCRGPDRGAVCRFEPFPRPDCPDPRYTRVAGTIGAFLARLEPHSWPLTELRPESDPI